MWSTFAETGLCQCDLQIRDPGLAQTSHEPTCPSIQVRFDQYTLVGTIYMQFDMLF